MAKLNSAIGVEYNSHEVRAVELTKVGDGYKVTAFGKEILNEAVFSEGMISDSNLFSAAIDQMLGNGKFKAATPTVIGVNNENVIMRYATFPKVESDKLRSVITMQAQDFIPVPINELGLDFVVIDEVKDDDDQPVLNVLLIGAKTIMLENLITNLEYSKLEVVDIDSSFLAWCRIAIAVASDEDTFGFLKLTDDVLNFVAISGKEIKMVRSINIPDRASIEVKKAFNEPDTLTDLEMQTISDLLYSELSSSLNYFQMQNGTPISSVLFSAATDIEEELLKKISEKASVPVAIPHFYSEYMDSTFDPTDYAGCISLAKVALEG